jgi:hypothetical protein
MISEQHYLLLSYTGIDPSEILTGKFDNPQLWLVFPQIILPDAAAINQSV